MRMLVVEDNAVQRCILQSMLADGDVSVDSVGSGQAFRARYTDDQYDVLVLDLMLPDVDGLSLINELRAGYDSIPIVVITGLAKLSDKVRCLEAGADDYLVKPFSHVELLARVRAVTRRSFRIRGAAVRAGHVLIDEPTKKATCKDRVLDLRPSEFKLLLLLIRRLGFEVSRESIAALLRAGRGDASSNAVDKLVSRLRTALGAVDSGVVIRTIRGGGYSLEAISSVAKRSTL